MYLGLGDHEVARSLRLPGLGSLWPADDSAENSARLGCCAPPVYGMVQVRRIRTEVLAMRKLAFAVVLMLPLTTSPGGAGVLDTLQFEGNDTGGIIAWSPQVDLIYHQIADIHCAGYNKVAQITSAHRWFGDYIAFRCHFPRGYDPRKWMLYGPPMRVLN